MLIAVFITEMVILHKYVFIIIIIIIIMLRFMQDISGVWEEVLIDPDARLDIHGRTNDQHSL